VVRENAARAGFDCIFVPPTIEPSSQLSPETAQGTQADCRYLTQLDHAAVVLPTAGGMPIVINDRGRGNAWLPDVRSRTRSHDRGSWVEALVEALREVGVERGRIGVSGLKKGQVTHCRANDGCVIHSSYQAVLDALPNATFEDATDVVGYARYIKSEEELECLRHGCAIAEAGIEELVQTARPGADAALVYGRVMRRVLELGSEYYPAALTIGPLNAEQIRYVDPPAGLQLQPMDLIIDEIDGVRGGLVAQEDQPVLLGRLPEEWNPVVDIQGQVFEAGLEHMKPGTSFGEFIDFVNDFGQQRGLKTLILMHGRGAGNDGPLLTPRARGADIRDVLFQKNTAWVWKPYGMSADQRLQFAWGGCVVVTDRGGERLFKRPHGMVCVE